MPNLFIDVEARFAQALDALEKIGKSADKSFGGIQKSASNLKGLFATLGVGLSAGGLAAFIKSVSNSQDELGKLSQKVGVSVEGLSALKYAGDLADVSLDALGTGFKKLSVNMAETQANTGESKEAFKALGINVEAAKGILKSSEQVFAEIADKFAGFQDGANKTALAVKLFGKAGADLIPLLNQGSKGLKEAADEAQRFGILIGKDAAKAAEEFNDNLTRMMRLLEGAKIALGNSLIKPINEWVVANLEAIKIAGSFRESLRLFVFNLDAMTTEKPREQIVRLAAEFERLEKAMSGSLFKRSGIDQLFGNQKLQDIPKQIEFLKFLQRQEALARGVELGGDTPGERARAAGKALPTAPGLRSEAAEKAAQAAAAALADLIEARSKLAVDAEQSAAKQRLDILDHFYKAGFAEEQHYWQVRAQIQKSAYDIERAALDQSIAAREKEQARIAATPGQGKNSAEYHKATKDLIEAQAKRNKLDADFNALGNADVLARAKATEDYENAIKGVNIQLLELNGNTAEAARQRLELQNEPLRRQAESRDDLEGQLAITNLEKRSAAQAKFNELSERAEQVKARLAIEEERIQNSLRTGAIGEQEALKRTEIARRNALSTLGLTKQQLDEIANGEDGFEKLRLSAEQFGVQLETLASQSNLLNDQARELFSGAVVDGWKTFREELQKSGKVLDALGKGFERFALKIIDKIQDIQAANLAQALTGGSAGGGFIGLLAKLLGGVSGNEGGFGTFDTSSIPIDVFDSYASGTDFVPKTGPYMLHKGEQVIPASEVGSGGVSIVNTYNIDSRSDRSEIVSMIERSRRQTINDVADLSRRGGAYRRAVRGG